MNCFSRSMTKVMVVATSILLLGCAAYERMRAQQEEEVFGGMNRNSYGPLQPVSGTSDVRMLTANSPCTTGVNTLGAAIVAQIEPGMRQALEPITDQGATVMHQPLIDERLDSYFTHPGGVTIPSVRLLQAKQDAIDFLFTSTRATLAETDAAATAYCGRHHRRMVRRGISVGCGPELQVLNVRHRETFIIAAYDCIRR